MSFDEISFEEYNPSLSLLCAQLSDAIYMDFRTSDELAALKQRLDQLDMDTTTLITKRVRLRDRNKELATKFSNDPAVEAMICKHKNSDLTFLTIRGTDSNDLGEWLQNLDFKLRPRVGKPKFHSGFMELYELVSETIREWITSSQGKPLVLCGHSLGGALATIAATLNNTQEISAIYNFGTPRVGRFDSDDFQCPIFRVTNASDPIPEVPVRIKGRYKHVGIEMKFVGTEGAIQPVYVDDASDEIKEAAEEFFGHFSFDNFKNKEFLRSYVRGKIAAHRMAVYIDNLTKALNRTLTS